MQLALRLICLRQVANETVASPLQVQFAWAEYISFYSLDNNYNEPLAVAQAHIYVATH